METELSAQEVKFRIRATRIFKELMNTPLTIEQLSDRIELHKPTIYGIIQKLKKREFVIENYILNHNKKREFIYSPINIDKFDFAYESISESDYKDIPEHLLEAIKKKIVSPDIIRIYRATDQRGYRSDPKKRRHTPVNFQSSMEFI